MHTRRYRNLKNPLRAGKCKNVITVCSHFIPQTVNHFVKTGVKPFFFIRSRIRKEDVLLRPKMLVSGSATRVRKKFAD